MQSTSLRQTTQTPNFHSLIDGPMRGGLFIFLALIGSLSFAQERCGSTAPSTGEFENWISSKIANQRFEVNRPQATLYQIPVVVHVFHKGEPVGTGVNLSQERILAQIDSLTADFRRMNADAINTPLEFSAIAADIEIEFVLAKQDPAGLPTDGIVRLRGSRDTYRSNSHRPLLRSESYWPAEHYLNIFVTDLQIFLGYASFPRISLEGISNNEEDFTFDGVLMDYEYFGVNPTAPAFESLGRTLTHEVGHYLGLRHIWGDGNCSVDDFVDDTPLADNDNGDYTSPCTFPNPDDTNVCIDGEPEMFQNYMDYTDDVCMNLFTVGQKARMRTVMDNAPNRLSLTTSPGLVDPTRFTNDLAITHILSPKYSECDASLIPTVRIVNYGTSEVTSYDIQLSINSSPAGSPQSIVTSLPPLSSDTITFSNQLITSTPSSISFEISNVNGTADNDLSNNIFSKELSATSSITLPFQEDFEGTVNVLGLGGGSFPWEVLSAPKTSPSNQAYTFKSHQNTQWFGEETLFKTPIFDLTGISSGDLIFSYAHANSPNSFYDGLMVKASVDCGETFPDIIFTGFGPELATASETDTYFTPSNQLEWIDTLLSITDYKDIDGVQFAFVGINGSGNNIYIDDIGVIETNLFENDIKPISLSGPLITCSEQTKLTLGIRNVGSQTINSFEVNYSVNGSTFTQTYSGLTISSKDFASFSFALENIPEGESPINLEIVNVNNLPDESADGNSIQIQLERDDREDEYPLTVDFESADIWSTVSDGTIPLWNRVEIDGNGMLRANGFNSPELGTKSWFVSPKLNVGGLDSAGLQFTVSYAKRIGFNDRLQVLLSVDCGESYPTTLLDADSDSLALLETSEQWVPTSNIDWEEFQLDLSGSIPFKDDIRIAFVFTSGGGNDLFIDDIQIRGNELPTYEDVGRAYPNPAFGRFNLGLNLPVKEPVTIRLIDVSGRVVIEDFIENGFNQIIEYKTPSKEGLYFLTISGNQFVTTQKLFINR
ncbi:choice-of-anchor J domain-containing protein [Ekhidna sp.]